MGRSARFNSTCMTERKEGAATTNTIAFNPEIKLNAHWLNRKQSPNTKTGMYVPVWYVHKQTSRQLSNLGSLDAYGRDRCQERSQNMESTCS